MLGAVVAGIAIDQVVPFGRVWSFPKDIVIANVPTGNIFLNTEWVSLKILQQLKHQLMVVELFKTDWEKDFQAHFPIGSSLEIKLPQRLHLETHSQISSPPDQSPPPSTVCAAPYLS